MTPQSVFEDYCIEQNEAGKWITDYPPLEDREFDTEDALCDAMYQAATDCLMDCADSLRKAARGG